MMSPGINTTSFSRFKPLLADGFISNSLSPT
jgi:hypothetical protein